MPKPAHIELPDGPVIAILHEDRATLAIDKPSGWMLAPESWTRTGRNLHLALFAAVQRGDFWARSRGLRFLRYVHRLDADTSGVLLLAKSMGAVRAYSELFETRGVNKRYLAVVTGTPRQASWICQQKLSKEPDSSGRIRVDPRHGNEAETHFRVMEQRPGFALIEALPMTGRTHQIRVHLQAAGYPVLNDRLYEPQRPGPPPPPKDLALRAVTLEFTDPFQHRRVRIVAPTGEFLRQHGFSDKSAASSAAVRKPA